MTSRRSSGSSRADSSVEPTRSQNTTVSCRPQNSVKPGSAQPRRDRKFADSLLEGTGFELPVPCGDRLRVFEASSFVRRRESLRVPPKSPFCARAPEGADASRRGAGRGTGRGNLERDLSGQTLYRRRLCRVDRPAGGACSYQAEDRNSTPRFAVLEVRIAELGCGLLATICRASP